MQRIHVIPRILFGLLALLTYAANAQQQTGVYSYSKGLNKPGGTLYLTHFKPDSAFFYLSTLSGMPEFLTTDLRGFLSIDSNQGTYRGKDLCRLQFQFSKTGVSISQDSSCQFEYTTDGNYKKTATSAKRSATMHLNFTERSVKPSGDSVRVYSAPHMASSNRLVACRENDLKIIDEFRTFYLVEHKKFKSEFLWVPKSIFPLPKKP